MATNISVITVNAPVQKVWEVLTQPAEVKKWQYGSDLVTSWQPGSEIRFRSEWQGKVFEQWGRVLEVIPNLIIRYNLFAPRPGLEDSPENYFVMTYELKEEEQQIRLTIIQEDNRPGAVQEEPQGEENPALAALKALIEDIKIIRYSF